MNLFKKFSGSGKSNLDSSGLPLTDYTGKMDISMMLFADEEFQSMEEAFLHLMEVQEFIVENKPVKAVLLGLIATSLLFSKLEKRGSGFVYQFKMKDFVSLIGPDEIFTSSALKSFDYEKSHELRGRRTLLRFNLRFEISGIYGDPLLRVFMRYGKGPESLSKAPSYLKLWRLQMRDHKRGTQFLLV